MLVYAVIETGGKQVRVKEGDTVRVERLAAAPGDEVTLNAYKVTQKDIDELRSHGFSDAEILDVALTATARNFFSKTLDAVGAEPDPEYLKLENSLREVLAVGRPFGPPGRGADAGSPAG